MSLRRATFIGLVLIVLGACDQSPTPTGDDVADASPPGPNEDADLSAPDAGPDPQSCAPSPDLPRGLAWVRDNPMFVSGLVPHRPAPPAAAVHQYFDDFGATAAHLWQASLPDKMDAWAAAGNPAFRFVAWTKDDGTNHGHPDVIGGYGPDAPGRIGYQVGDEPRDWPTMYAIGEGADAIRSTDPDALIIVNFSYLADDIDVFLDHYGQNIDGDVVSYDRYTSSEKLYGTMAKFRLAGLTHGMPYWAYLDAYRDAGHDAPKATDMRWTAMAHALYGFTGYSWFIYQIGPGDKDSVFFAENDSWSAAPTAAFDVAAQLNRELVNLGRVLTQVSSTDVRYISSIGGFLQPEGTQPWSPGAGGDPYLAGIDTGGQFQDLLIGFFEDDCGEVYVMVQNPNHESGSFPTESASPTSVTLQFSFPDDPEEVSYTQIESFDKATGEIEIVALDHVDPGTASVVVELAAGDVFFYKYSTGVPWALQPL